jgi:hypothetical protein
MNKQEFATFSMALKTYYPREQLLPNQQAMELWFNQLKDIDYNVAKIVLNKWVANNKWSPSIAEIREQAVELLNGKEKDWGEAWEDVIRNIRYFGYYRASEGMAAITDDLTRETVKRLGYTNLCLSDNSTVDRANFRMIYESLAQRKKMDKQLPKDLLKLIGEIQIGLIEGGKNDGE